MTFVGQRNSSNLTLVVMLAALLSGTISPHAQATTTVHGMLRTCNDYADLDYALNHPYSLYFKEWSSADFDAAQQWVRSCFKAPPEKQDIDRDSLLAARRKTLEDSGDLQRIDKAIEDRRATDLRDQAEQATAERQTAREAAEHREAEIERLRKEAVVKQDQEAREGTRRRASAKTQRDCLDSTAYKLYLAASHIVDAVKAQGAAQETLDRESRVEKLSGTENLLTKRWAAENIVSAQDEIAKWWPQYRQLGGSAQSPDAVPGEQTSPCK